MFRDTVVNSLKLMLAGIESALANGDLDEMDRLDATHTADKLRRCLADEFGEDV